MTKFAVIAVNYSKHPPFADFFLTTEMSFAGILGIGSPRVLQRTWNYIFGFTMYWLKTNAV